MSKKPELRCCAINRHGVHCENVGVPEDGFDFYCCEDCCRLLEECLEAEGRKLYGRHTNN